MTMPFAALHKSAGGTTRATMNAVTLIAPAHHHHRTHQQIR
jgi:hypothetical protein